MDDSIYAAFVKLEPDQIKALVSAEVNKAGMRHYERQQFSHYSWVEPAKRLRAIVELTGVEFWQDGESWQADCKCGGYVEQPCSHIVASLYTFCNLMNDQYLPVFFRDNKEHEHLHNWFWSSYHEGDSFDAHVYDLRIEPGLPAVLKSLGARDQRPVYFGDNQHLHQGLQGIVVSSEHARFNLVLPGETLEGFRFEPDAEINGTCELDVDEDYCIWGRIELVDEDLPGVEALRAANEFIAVNLVEQSFSLYRMPGAIQSADEGPLPLKDLLRIAPEPLQVDAKRFNSSDYVFSRPLGSRSIAPGYRFMCEGDVQLPEERDIRLVALLNRVFIGDETYLKFRLCCMLDGVSVDELASVYFRNVMPILFPSRQEARATRKIDRHLRFLDTWFLPDREGSRSKARSKYQPRDPEVTGQIKRIVGRLTDYEYFQLQWLNGKWCFLRVPILVIGAAFASARRVLGAETTWLDNEIQLRAVEGENSSREVPALAKVLGDLGIEMRVDEQEVRRVSLDFDVTASPCGDRDWFELHPAVRMRGRTLMGEEWLKIIMEGGMFWEQGELLMLEPDDLETLSAIHQLSGQASDIDEGIVRVPRLEMFKWLDLKRRGLSLDLPEEVQNAMESLENLDSMPRYRPPSGLNAILRPYQVQGYSWLMFHYAQQFGACLADDMGLGKTLQTITMLGAIKEGVVASTCRFPRPHLVVVPSSLVFNWHLEINRFFPGLRVYEYLGPNRHESFEDFDVVITTYGTLGRSMDRLEYKAFDVAVFDEAQAVKNIKSDRTRAARMVQAEFKLCLTGTPVENHLGEYYSIIDLALPGLLGSHQEFIQRDDALDFAVRMTRPFLMRRTKSQILTELPPKVEREVVLDLSPLQKECYTRTVSEVTAEVEDAYSGKPGAQASVVALTALLRLRQACVSPVIHDPTITELSPKIRFLTDELVQLRDEGHAALLFSQFTRALDLVEEQLSAEGIRFLRLDGRTPTDRRKELVEEFQSENGPAVFLISLKAGGVGLNLTRASYVYHLDPWWNPAAENQATDRAHRMGQKSTVFVTRLVMRHTVEEKIMELKREKQAVFDAVVEGTGGQGGRAILTREDFAYLLDQQPQMASVKREV